MGRLIVIEGTDGSGKGTQTELLAQWLRKRGQDPLLLSFPDYESLSSGPARLYLDGKIRQNPDEVNAYAASSFYSVDRYISYRTRWEDAYRSGRLILCNRYTTSNITHQMEKLPREEWTPFIDWLCDFEYEKLGLPRPDLVLYLDMDVSVSQTLIEKRYSGNTAKKDIHERDPDYLRRCREGALCAAERLGWRVLREFEGAPPQPRPMEQIAGEIAQQVERLLSL